MAAKKGMTDDENGRAPRNENGFPFCVLSQAPTIFFLHVLITPPVGILLQLIASLANLDKLQKVYFTILTTRGKFSLIMYIASTFNHFSCKMLFYKAFFFKFMLRKEKKIN